MHLNFHPCEPNQIMYFSYATVLNFGSGTKNLDKLKVCGWIYLLTAIASNPFVNKAAKEPDMNPAMSSSIPRFDNYGTYFFFFFLK